jgi:hypothetical protein
MNGSKFVNTIRKKGVFEMRESKRMKELIKGSNIFNGDAGGKLFLTDDGLKPKPDYLLNSRNNLLNYINQEVIDYFVRNEIEFWKTGVTGVDEYNMPTGHTLSSQIACLNHLFPFRNDKNAVESIFGFPNAEKTDDGYIAFEYINKNKTYLKECCETRGTKCTSIDAFVKANNVGISIEWKYTETDFDTTQAKPHWKETYNERYKPLLKNSNIIESEVLISCQMYYELMRQTLLLEQMKNHNEIGDYKNIVVCPEDNVELYDCCTKWKDNLKDKTKFEVIDPQVLLANIDKIKYKELVSYLSERYWQ